MTAPQPRPGPANGLTATSTRAVPEICAAERLRRSGWVEEINQLVEAMNAHDLDAVVQLFHSDYHSEQPAHPAREFGTSAQVRANWDAMFGGIPDFRAELVRSADDGHTCWNEWQWLGQPYRRPAL